MLFWLFACQSYSITISPQTPTTTDTLSFSVYDHSGNRVQTTEVLWLENDIGRVDYPTVDPHWTDKNESWKVQVTLDNGEKLLSDAVVIGNSLPTAEFSFTPEQPTADYDVTCHVETYDEDGDEVSHIIWWSKDDIVVDSPVLPANQASEGEWICHTLLEDDSEKIEHTTFVYLAPLSALPDTSNMLHNTSFEEMESNAWNYDGCSIVGTYQNHIPVDGNNMLVGGQDDCQATQNINVVEYGILPQHVDSLRLRLHIDGYLANKGTSDDYDDQIKFRVFFLDAEGAILAELHSLFAGEGEWIYRDAQRVLPVGTRSIQVQVFADWRADQWNDSFADAISLRIEPANMQEASVQKYPMLQDYRQDAMKIIWETDGSDHDPVVLWGDDLENSITNIRSTWIDEDHVVHVAEIEGLSPSQTVSYHVPVDDVAPSMLTTAPEEGDNFSMVWLGDNQEAYTRFTQHIEHFSQRNPNMLFVVGDLVQFGSKHDEWRQMWWEPLQTNSFAQTTPVLAARGNHDLDHPYAYAYVDLPENSSSYAFMYGDVYILVLNSHADLFPSPDPSFSGQYEYIEAQLQSAEAQSARFRIAAFHQAPYSNSSASSTPDQIYGNKGIRDFWVPLFEEYDVDVVIGGHYHSYQRGERNGITYLVTGGGGSTLLVQNFDTWDWMDLNLTYQYTMMYRENDVLRWETYNLDDILIDSFVVE